MNKYVLGIIVIATIILAIIGLLSLIRQRTTIVTKKDSSGNCQLYIDDKYVGQTIERFGNLSENNYPGTKQMINYATVAEEGPTPAPIYNRVDRNMTKQNLLNNDTVSMKALQDQYECDKGPIKHANEKMLDYVNVNTDMYVNKDNYGDNENNKNQFRSGYNIDNYINYGIPADVGIINLDQARLMYPTGNYN
jgi:hypothetical protein